MNTAAKPLILVRLLGGISACAGEVETTVRSRPAALLLGRLAAPPRTSHRREALIDGLFPECAPEAGRSRLRQSLYLLRQELEPLGLAAGSVVIADRETVSLGESVGTDAGEFHLQLQRAGRAPAAVERTRWLEAAVAAYGGEFLPGHYDDWSVRERERLREGFAAALCELAEERVRAGNPAAAVEHARRAVQADALREESHRALMRALAAAGRTVEAERHYREVERLLREELDLAPSGPTRALREEIRRGAAAAIEAPPPEPSPSASPLPRPVNRIYGRAEEMARVERWLVGEAAPGAAPSPLVTLTGPGGSGKTRLALELAHRLENWFDGAAWFVPLEAVPAPAGFLDAVAEAVGLPGSPEGPLAGLRSRLRRDRGALLVLDNFEHLLDGAALQLQELRSRIPGLACLVTSRQRLRLGGEQELRLDPLPVPTSEVERPDDVWASPAVQLFVGRAQASRSEFALTQENVAAVAELCRRLDGLPLALELGASWMAVLSPQQALERLIRGAVLPDAPAHDLPTRHRSLQAALDGSYRLLPEPEQRFFRRLSVFRDGWTLEAAEALCGDSGGALGLLRQLVESSLVRADERRGAVRYRLLEPLREYAEALAAQAGETPDIAADHAVFFHARATSFRDSVGENKLADREIEADFENYRAALESLLTHPETGEQALELGWILGFFCFVRGRLAEGKLLVQRAIASGPAALSPARMSAHLTAALLARLEGDATTARELLLEARSMAAQLESPRAAFRAASYLASIGFDGDDAIEVETWIRECEAINRELGDPVFELLIAFRVGCHADRSGDLDRSRKALERCVELARQQGARRNLGDALCALGWTYRSDQPTFGLELLRESVGIHREIEHPLMETQALLYTGMLELLSGDRTAGGAAFRKALKVGVGVAHRGTLVRALAGLAAVAAAEKPEHAAVLFGAASAAEPATKEAPERDPLALGLVARPRAQCAAGHPAAWLRGTELPLDEAIALALSVNASEC